MKHLLICAALLFVIAGAAVGQGNEEEYPVVRFGFGIGPGFFYPEDVSNYLKAEYSGSSSINMEIYVNFVGSLALTISPAKALDLVATVEYGWAPKFVVGSGFDDYFHFDRVSPGVLCNFNIPLGSGRHAFFLGAGGFYHMMSFDDLSASTIGPRVQAGVNFRFGRLNPQVVLAFDYAVAETEYQADGLSFIPSGGFAADSGSKQKLEMNYTGLVIGLKLNF